MAEFGTKPSLLNGMPNDQYCRKGTCACLALKLAAIGSFPETRQPGNDLLPKKFARAMSAKGKETGNDFIYHYRSERCYPIGTRTGIKKLACPCSRKEDGMLRNDGEGQRLLLLQRHGRGKSEQPRCKPRER
jgi:hypothetical protein